MSLATNCESLSKNLTGFIQIRASRLHGQSIFFSDILFLIQTRASRFRGQSELFQKFAFSLKISILMKVVISVYFSS